jgi:hypothetical protein
MFEFETKMEDYAIEYLILVYTFTYEKGFSLLTLYSVAKVTVH